MSDERGRIGENVKRALVKLQADEPLDMRETFALQKFLAEIDSMPYRRQKPNEPRTCTRAGVRPECQLHDGVPVAK